MLAHRCLRPRLWSALLLVGSVLLLEPISNAQTASAIWSHQTLSLTLPVYASHAGSGRLAVELLSPEDKVLAEAQSIEEARIGDNTWQQQLTVPRSVPFEQLVWERVRWRFQFDGTAAPAVEQIRSVSMILRRPRMHILGQNAYLTGAQAAVRVVVTDATGAEHDAAQAASSGALRVDLLVPNARPRVLFTGHLDRRGTMEADFRFPEGLTGQCGLRFVADTPTGTVETTETVRLENKVSILLTTEKPIYQPSQTIHIRALALDRSNEHAAAGRKLSIELEDSRGNKVFRKSTETDRFGIASAEFTLADEVNLGAYHLRALMGDSDSPLGTAEVTLNVQRYVLPKFRVAIEFTAVNGRPKRDYRPGDHVTGVVHANYFFGKPVDHAAITVKATGADVTEFEAARVEGRTDAAGDYRFDLRLPAFFAGSSLAQGSAPVLIDASVKDGAAHTEARDESITVSRSPLLILAVPESGTLIPGIENQVYLLTSYPDGTPAQTALTVGLRTSAQKLATDASGVATVTILPPKGTQVIQVEADDGHGHRASSTLQMQSRSGEDQLLLRTSRAVVKPGEPLDITVLSTRQRGAAYVDLVRDGQTILMRDVDLVNGRADLSVDVTPAMTGTLALDAYVFGRDAQAISDRRLVFVQPADELRIEATADAPSYLPGSEAQVHFHVTNARGQGVVAALGLQVVDEAVFALAEKQPGFAKVFFYLEEQLMKPRYEIHSLSPEAIVQPTPDGQAEQRDRDARVLFSAAEMINPHSMDVVAGRELPQNHAAEYASRYQEAFVASVRLLAEKLNEAAANRHQGDLPHLFAALEKPHDAWGTDLRLEPMPWYYPRGSYYQVRSAGPDQVFNTADDLTIALFAHDKKIVAPGLAGSIDVDIEHDRGPFNGLAEISGTVCDATAALIPGASIQLRAVASGSIRHAVSGADGSFRFSGLASGSYQLRISAPGFISSERRLDLGPRDRAVAHATLNVGAATQTVMVDARPMELDTTAANVAMQPMAKAAPVMGGVVGALGTGASVRSRAQNEMSAQPQQQAGAEPHVRSYFPEALYINPEIVTDSAGSATIKIPMADSITTWRMAMFASTAAGALGTGASALRVFQDFFVDLDLPVTLTQGDRVSIPVAVYNYSGHRGAVALSLQPEDWFTLVDDSAEKSVSLDAGQVGGSQFTIQAQRIGRFRLTLSAKMNGGSGRRDVVVREIEVVPNGREQDIVFNGRLDSSVQHTIQFPHDAIPDASRIFVRVYPGPLSQVVEGMDSILRMPFGCFEQTSSSTYPNVLALDYMKRNHKLTPEVHAKAEGYIANGYQRLLTFEVPGGGFSWFGQAPANKILTAYGLMEFHDMSRVYDVDSRVIARTGQWLAGRQKPDGSWEPDTQFINEGATNRYNSDVLRITGYIAWALEIAGDQGEAVAKAREYIGNHLNENADAYTLAVLANFAAESDKDSDLTHRIIGKLVEARTEKGDLTWWNSEETSVYGRGESAAVETTGLAVQALLKSGQNPEVARRALAWILSKKGADGNWGTTQATIMALRALLLASDRGSGDAHGTLEVQLNGKIVDTLALTAENNDLFQQFVLPVSEGSPENNVALHFTGNGGVAYQIVGRYFVSWPSSQQREPLSIEVGYDRTHLAQDELVSATATIRNNLHATANMVMVDLGIPPGFDLLTEDLQDFVEKTSGARSGRLEKFSLTATQAILYFDSIGAGQTVKVTFRLRAKYPIHAKNFASRVYEYYDPAVSATAAPVQFDVTRR